MNPVGLLSVSLILWAKRLGRSLIIFFFSKGRVAIVSMHDSSSEDIFIPSEITKSRAPKIAQLVMYPSCDVTGGSYEVIHDCIDQAINFIKGPSS